MDVIDTIWRKTPVKIPNLTIEEPIDIRYYGIFNINLRNSTAIRNEN